MAACRDFLSALSCPTAVLMGNHDVEYRPDETVKRSPMEWYGRLFGREKAFCAFETEEALMLCLTVERQPEETLRTQHALYASDGQYEWAKAQLERNGGRPVIVFSHAPIAGSGLRCFPPIHSAATDAHMDHTFDAMRWRRLPEEYPQIRLWCSAHFHMGHDYDAAIVRRGSTVHVSAGVMTSAARDGSRHTRILDVSDGRAVIMTLDHRENALRQDAVVPLTGDAQPEGRMACGRTDEMLLGEDHALKAFVFPETGRGYVITEGGMLWEYDRELQEISGAILNEKPARAVSMDGDRLYVEMENGGFFSVRLGDPGRFDRRSGYTPQEARPETGLKGARPEPAEYDVRSAREGEYVRLRF